MRLTKEQIRNASSDPNCPEGFKNKLEASAEVQGFELSKKGKGSDLPAVTVVSQASLRMSGSLR